MSRHRDHADAYVDRQLDDQMVQVLSLKYAVAPDAIRGTLRVYHELFDRTYRSMAGVNDAVPEEILSVEVNQRLAERGVYGSTCKRQFGAIAWDYLMFSKQEHIQRWILERGKLLHLGGLCPLGPPPAYFTRSLPWVSIVRNIRAEERRGRPQRGWMS